MAVTLTHPTAFAGARKPAVSWFRKLILSLASFTSLIAEVREEERKAHARFPHFVEW
jgi:hypothetical protein